MRSNRYTRPVQIASKLYEAHVGKGLDDFLEWTSDRDSSRTSITRFRRNHLRVTAAGKR